ncbi:MAG: phosphoenolpyruvate carboxylase, partial [Candidatus Chisholmbacteria bacterium]|nr:phosphoenolpyruvate carboxylase [Candidatus Chisholmbacteria bacterium]
MITRRIPATMASQHPDHARVPYWQQRAFISTRAEAKECWLTFSELGVTEYKWDWEGKLVDESVIERLLAEHFQYFKKNPLGEKKFLTFRLPNPRVETEFRLGRAFTSMLTAAGLTKEVGFSRPP